jgi:hypothetical protein
MSIPVLLTQVAISLVMVVLYHLWVSRKKQPAPAPPAVLAPVAAPIAAPPKALPAPEAIPAETVAVIAAAIAVVLDGPHRVVSVLQAAAHAPEVNVWALEGRMQQFQSHKVR